LSNKPLEDLSSKQRITKIFQRGEKKYENEIQIEKILKSIRGIE
jgi:hypothetical protein